MGSGVSVWTSAVGRRTKDDGWGGVAAAEPRGQSLTLFAQENALHRLQRLLTVFGGAGAQFCQGTVQHFLGQTFGQGFHDRYGIVTSRQ